MKCKTRKVGNSVVVTIPKEMREGIKLGEDIELFTKEEVIAKINEFIAGTPLENAPSIPEQSQQPETPAEPQPPQVPPVIDI